MKIIAEADVNRQIAALLREVKQGETFTIVSQGTAIATLSPARPSSAVQLDARRRLLERLKGKRALNGPRASRDDLYDI